MRNIGIVAHSLLIAGVAHEYCILCCNGKKSMVGPGEKKTDKKSQVAFYAQTVIFMSNSEPTLKYLLL